MLRSVHPLKVIVLAAVLGTAGGVGLSLRKQANDRKELKQVKQLADTLPAEHFPPAPRATPADMSAPPVDPRALEGIPPYPNANPRDLAQKQRVQGDDLHMAWFTTDDDIDQVLGFYEKKFSDMGRFLVHHRFSPGAGYVGYLDMGDEKLHLISVMKNRGHTVVFPSVSYPGKYYESAGGQLPQTVPVLPNAQGSVVFDFDEGASARRSYFATVEQKLDDVADFYSKGFTEKGWKVEEVNHALPSEVRIDARRGDSSASVVLKKREGQTVAIYVSIAGQV
ncbi:MAG: hypothetical protein QM723_33000 [Myxococcaceae bacterium]